MSWRLAKQREFLAEFVEDVGETGAGGSIGAVDSVRCSESFYHQVDGAVVEMQAASVGQELDLSPHWFVLLSAAGERGHGFSGWALR
jgi:glycine cleavage system H lipoate-binding protein